MSSLISELIPDHERVIMSPNSAANAAASLAASEWTLDHSEETKENTAPNGFGNGIHTNGNGNGHRHSYVNGLIENGNGNGYALATDPDDEKAGRRMKEIAAKAFADTSYSSLPFATSSVPTHKPKSKSATRVSFAYTSLNHSEPDSDKDHLPRQCCGRSFVCIQKGHCCSVGYEDVQAVKKFCKFLWSGEKFTVRYLFAETKRSSRGFAIGLFTVFLVVAFSTLLYNAVLKAPIIFFKIAENSVGENDLLLTPGAGLGRFVAWPRVVNNADQTSLSYTDFSSTPIPILNQTYFDESFHTPQQIKGDAGAPRWLLSGRVFAQGVTSDTLMAIGGANAILLGIEQSKETYINLGRSWPFMSPLPLYHTIVQRGLVREMGFQLSDCVGKSYTLRFGLFDLLTQIADNGGAARVTVAAADMSGSASQSSSIDPASTVTEADIQLSIFKSIVQTIYPPVANYWDTPIDNTRLMQTLTNALQLESTANTTTLLNALIDAAIILNQNSTNPINEQAARQLLNSSVLVTTTLTRANAILSTNYTIVDVEELLHASVIYLNDAVGQGENAGYDNGQTTDVAVNNFLVSLRNYVNGNATLNDLALNMMPILNGILRYDVPLTIDGYIDYPSGKYAEALGSVITMETETFYKIAQEMVQSVVYYNLSALDANITLPPIYPGLPPIVIHLHASLRQLLTAGLGANPDLVSTPAFIASIFMSNTTTEKQLDDAIRSTNSQLQSSTSYGFALFSVTQFENRVAAYSSDLNSLMQQLIQFTNAVAEDIGIYYPVQFSLPIYFALQASIYVRYFLDAIFGSVVALMVALGILLIYSLLLHDVQSKTYEYGMLRALGMTHKLLIQILVNKAVLFAVPGVGIGLFIAFIFSLPVVALVYGYADLPPQYQLDWRAIVVAVCVGLAMPLIANIVPISRALSKTLRDSLDLYHAVVSETKVRMIKLSELGLDLWQTLVALLMVVLGFVTFYLIPYAFTFGNIPMFLGVLNSILLGMLFGLCVCAQIVQPVLERLILRGMLSYYHKYLYNVVKKNLNGHRRRNGKTSMMFTLALAFLIFAAVMFQLQASTLVDNVRAFFGGDIYVQATKLSNPSYAIPEQGLRDFLDREKQMYLTGQGGSVKDYTFVSFPINNLPNFDYVRISNLPEYPAMKDSIVAVERNYLEASYYQFYLNSETDGTGGQTTPQGQVDPVKVMYDSAGKARVSVDDQLAQLPRSIVSSPVTFSLVSNPNNRSEDDAQIHQEYTDYIDVLVSEALRPTGSVDTNTPMSILTEGRYLSDNSWRHLSFLAKARAMLIKFPGFIYSSYRQTASISTCIIRQDQYKMLVKKTIGVDLTNIPMQKMHVMLADGISREKREDVINGIRTIIGTRQFVVDVVDILETMNFAVLTLNLFFDVVGVLSMIMCFFILYLSFHANVNENAWEFGVLRAIGLNSFDTIMVYVYEAVSLVVASIILGTAIGIVIALSLTLQFNLFTELPLKIEFPYPLFLILILMALSVSIFGSAYPAHQLTRKTISNVLRHT